MPRRKISLLRALRDNLPRSGRLLLAVSGGIDSSVLLHGCVEIKDELDLYLEVAHVDHGLREKSADDAHFVSELCRKLNINCLSRVLSPASVKDNLEHWGRRERYAFFSELLDERGLEYTVTAHTADDVAETFLMRLVSNKELNSIERCCMRRRCLRPLLDVSREEIERYAAVNNIPYREDESNFDTRLLRNRIRHKTIPALRDDYDPRISEVLSIRAEAVQEDINSLYELADRAAERTGGLEFGSREWLREVRGELSNMLPAVKWRYAERLLKNKLGFNLGRCRSKSLVSFLSGETAGIELPGGISLCAHGGGIKIRGR